MKANMTKFKARKLITFERACGIYWAFSIAAALVIPNNLELDKKYGVDPESIPLASVMVDVAGRVDYIGLYFIVMWALSAILMGILAAHPQDKVKLGYLYMDFARAARATLGVLAAATGCAYMLFMDPVSCFNEMGRGRALICFAAKYKMGLGVIGGGLMLTFTLIAYLLIFRVPAMWKEYLVQRR